MNKGRTANEKGLLATHRFIAGIFGVITCSLIGWWAILVVLIAYVVEIKGLIDDLMDETNENEIERLKATLKQLEKEGSSSP